MYAIKMNEIEMEQHETTMEQSPILKEFQDLFMEEIP